MVDISADSMREISNMIASQVAAEVEKRFATAVADIESRFSEKIQVISDQLAEVRVENRELHNELSSMREELEDVHTAAESQEQYGRRLNVRFENIKHDTDETSAICFTN